MTTVYLIRHGESEGNARRSYCGWTDVPLTQKGRGQAEDLGRRFQEPLPVHIVCSDLSRATETAQIVSRNWYAAIHQEKDFREMNFGAFENRTWEDIKGKYPSPVERWTKDWFYGAVPEGESLEMVYHRAIPLFREYLNRWQGGTWGLVAHSGVIQAILSMELTGSHENHWRFSVDNGKAVRIDYDHNNFAVLKGFNL